MDAFLSNYLAELTASLTSQILNAMGRRLREAIAGPDKEQAIRRCVQAGIAAMLATASTDSRAKLDHIEGLFRKFFGEPEVGKEVEGLLRGKALDHQSLTDLFADSGFEKENLLWLDFDKAIVAFEAAFLCASVAEETLQGIIQTTQVLQQTQLHREFLDMMKALVLFLRQAHEESLAIQRGKITGENLKDSKPLQFIVRLPDSQPPTANWLELYLKIIIKRCDPLDLSPIDKTFTQTGKLDDDFQTITVSDVFTTLYLSRVARSPKQTVAAALTQKEESLKKKRAEPDEKQIRIQAAEAVAALDRLVILGQPGGGKSTLVNHIATQLARRLLGEPVAEEKLPGWRADAKPLPVIIVLRRFAAWIPDSAKKGTAGLVWEYLSHELQQWGCKEALEHLKARLINEGGIVFFDGLDEVRESDEDTKRSLITTAISEFAAYLEKCRVVVTCREYAYKPRDDWRLPAKDFPVVELALFDEEQMQTFTHTWYQVVGPRKGWSKSKSSQEAKKLADAIHNLPHLQELGQYPLLLTLMAQVHGRDGYLPEDRADLYKEAVDLLLAHWENRIVRDVAGERKIEPGLVMRLGIRTETLRSALEQVAYAAHERQEKQKNRSESAADIPKDDLREHLKISLGSIDKADEVIDYIQTRAGLLQARDNRIYTFPHRTFQEYLAATHILKQPEFDELLKQLLDRDLAWWREVFLLAAGAQRGTPRIVSNLVDGLLIALKDTTAADPSKTALIQVAAQALSETNFMEHVLKQQAQGPGRFTETLLRVQNGLLTAIRSTETLDAKERSKCGISLANLRDPRDEVMTIDHTLFCLVPAGPFQMGSPDDDKIADSDEKQLHLVKHLNYPYWISKYPITNAQFDEFVKADGYKEKDFWQEAIDAEVWKAGKVKGWNDDKQRIKPHNFGLPFNLPNHPVVGVTWYEALAFARWIEGYWKSMLVAELVEANVVVALPSEAEWEKAARGGKEIPVSHLILPIQKLYVTNPKNESLRIMVAEPVEANDNEKRRYPWHDEPGANLANYSDTGIGATSAVGCFASGVSPYGCEEMSGNVWEWTRSLYVGYPYPDDSEHREKRELLAAPKDKVRVLRGGAFHYIDRNVRCAYRFRGNPYSRSSYVGFRVVVRPLL